MLTLNTANKRIMYIVYRGSLEIIESHENWHPPEPVPLSLFNVLLTKKYLLISLPVSGIIGFHAGF